MKRYAQSFALGLALALLTVFGYVASISIWNRTINVADRLWYYNGQTLSSGEMRTVSLAFSEEHPQRPFEQMCANPSANTKGYSGVLVDETHGVLRIIEAPDVLFSDEAAGDAESEPTFTDELACLAVFPQSLGVMDYTKYILFSTFDPSNWF